MTHGLRLMAILANSPVPFCRFLRHLFKNTRAQWLPKVDEEDLVNGILLLSWALAVTVGLFCFYHLVIGLLHFCVTRFGRETTALVIEARRYHKDGDVYLQGHYMYRDAAGSEHLFDFTICSYWPGDEKWHRLMQLYTQGTQNRVRYLRWLPTLHEMQVSFPIVRQSDNRAATL